jgi:hypothetical protein
MTQESCEEYGDISSATFSFDNSRKALKDQSASQLRGVDDSIHFPLNSPTPSRYSNLSSTEDELLVTNEQIDLPTLSTRSLP